MQHQLRSPLPPPQHSKLQQKKKKRSTQKGVLFFCCFCLCLRGSEMGVGFSAGALEANQQLESLTSDNPFEDEDAWAKLFHSFRDPLFQVEPKFLQNATKSLCLRMGKCNCFVVKCSVALAVTKLLLILPSPLLPTCIVLFFSCLPSPLCNFLPKLLSAPPSLAALLHPLSLSLSHNMNTGSQRNTIQGPKICTT